MTIYSIAYSRNGRLRFRFFTERDRAEKAAAAIFDRTGIVVGIEAHEVPAS